MQITVDLTGFLAFWGAVLSTIAIAWDVYKWKTSGPRLSMRVLPGMKASNMPMYEGKTLIVVVVTNRGDRPTTLTHLFLEHYDARWKALLRRSKPTNRAVILIPNTVQTVPFTLGPGVEWSGMIDQDAKVETWARVGHLIVGVHHSYARRPLRRRVVLREEPPTS